MSFIPRPQEIYKHFKGKLYQIVTVAEHSETGELLVIYQALYGEFKIYARPLSMFISRVDREKYPETDQEFRFELQGEDAGRQTAGRESCESRTDRTDKESRTSQESETACEEGALDPLVLEFLDADSYEQRLNILAALHHRMTDEMLTTMAIACDLEVKDGELEERYEALRGCLLTLEKYECNRLH